MTVYSDYSRARIGWFFGLSGPQLATVSLMVLPVVISISKQAWASAGLFLLLWAAVVAVTVVPVQGRSVTGWLVASVKFAFGGLARWTRFRSRAGTGRARDLDEVDLPGVMQGMEIHEGPPSGHTYKRIAIIQNHATRTWAVTARIVHPGLGLCEGEDRDRYGNGLSELLDVAVRTELVDEVLLLVRTVPEDGAEREQWVRRHRRPTGPVAARRINDDLQTSLTSAAVRTEAFFTFVVPETRLAKVAKEAGGGLNGRARALYAVASELEGHLRGGLGVDDVDWLTSPELAIACRTGFAPGDRASIVEALGARETDPSVNADVPWAMAGPSGADPAPRHYSHDAWNSVSATLKLPVKGAAMGALAPVLSAREEGERRSFVVCYPVVSTSRADRQSSNAEWAADMGEELRTKAKMKQRTRSRDEADKVRRLEAKMARGNSMTEPYAVATVTVPKTVRAAEAGRRLDSAIRRAGFAPLRLDLAHDVAFATSTVPMGVSLARQGG
ncbi:SCO6880 family protein [Ornithinimicrobium cavernae]|uniref:SCO6880 family protein n=1 Tax=Ornithinimicrobium cavernae TaxID=2666047 RepID=UPI000D685DA1|nr:SCO6880 family protein [Ornithinimicrobium cavernae]